MQFSASVLVKAPADTVFDYFADYRHVANVLEGVSKWEPIGAKTRGLGARFSVEMNAFGLPLRNTLRLNRWKKPREIGWISEAGLIRQQGGFTFNETERGVRIHLRIEYEPPGFAIGAAIARRLDGIVRNRLQRALERIRDTLEA